MNSKRKIVIFEELNLVNLILAVIYRKIGFDVKYFMIGTRIKESAYFKMIRERFSIAEISKEQFDFETELFMHEQVLNSMDSIYESFFAKHKFLKIISSLFKYSSFSSFGC